MSSNRHLPATANKARHSKRKGHQLILTKYKAVHLTVVSENYAPSGKLIINIVAALRGMHVFAAKHIYA